MSLQNPPSGGRRPREGLGVEVPLNAAADSPRQGVPSSARAPAEPHPDDKIERKADRKRDRSLDASRERDRKLGEPDEHPLDRSLDVPGVRSRAAGAFKRIANGDRHRRSSPVNGLSLHDDRVTGPYRERELMAHEHHMSARRLHPSSDGDSPETSREPTAPAETAATSMAPEQEDQEPELP